MKFGQRKNNKTDDVLEVSETVETPEVTEANAERDYDMRSHAFSIVRHPEGGWALATLTFNPVTGDSKVLEIKRVGDSREDAEYFFKVTVGTYFASVE